MKNVFKLMKKELDKIFRDPRLIFTTILLPGILLFILYTLFGNISSDLTSDITNHTSVIYVYGDISELDPIWEIADLNVEIVKSDKISENDAEKLISEGKIDLYVESLGLVDNKLTISVYMDSSDTNSASAYSRVTSALSIYQQFMLQQEGIDISRFAINESKDFAKANGSVIMMISMLLPMMVVIMLFANAMNVASESITGEKERGTLATLIMTPIKRSQIIFSKVLSSTVISLATAISSFIGMSFSMNSFANILGAGSTTVTYGFGDYLVLLAAIVCVALISVSLFCIAGTLAKTIKEANALSMPLYICGLLCSVIASYKDVPVEWYYYLIPVYNCTAVMKSVFTFSLIPLNLIISIISSVAVFVGICLFLSYLFKKEKILFSY